MPACPFWRSQLWGSPLSCKSLGCSASAHTIMILDHGSVLCRSRQDHGLNFTILCWEAWHKWHHCLRSVLLYNHKTSTVTERTSKNLQVVEDVLALNGIARHLKAGRADNGALRLDNTKLFFKMDEHGNPVSAGPYGQCCCTPHSTRKFSASVIVFELPM